MNNAIKWILGILSVAPILLLGGSFFVVPIFAVNSGNREMVLHVDESIRIIGFLILVFSLIIFSAYIIKSSNPKLADKKNMWLLILLFGHLLALPIFWLLFVFDSNTNQNTWRAKVR